MDDNAEVKIYFSSSKSKNHFSLNSYTDDCQIKRKVRLIKVPCVSTMSCFCIFLTAYMTSNWDSNCSYASHPVTGYKYTINVFDNMTLTKNFKFIFFCF